jgi:hypothetical protein
VPKQRQFGAICLRQRGKDVAMPERKPPELWAQVRADFLAGRSAGWCARTHGVALSTLRKRARREKWRRADKPGPARPPGVETMAHAAFLRARAALESGDLKTAAEALKLATAASAWARPESLPKTRGNYEREAYDAAERKRRGR